MSAATDQRIANGKLQPIMGKRIAVLYHTITFGSSGAVSSQDALKDSGVEATKTAGETGRYTLQVWNGYRKLKGMSASVIVDDDTAVGNTEGHKIVWRDNDMGDDGAKDGTIELQFIDSGTSVDANPKSGWVVKIRLDLEIGY